MNKERLLKLADLLEADAKNSEGVKFDLGDWGTVQNLDQVVSCETYACAVGLAAISGAFKDEGLSYRITEPNRFTGSRGILITLNGEYHAEGGMVGSHVSARKFFDLTVAETDFLFVPDEYPGGRITHAKGERLVAKRIRNFVAGKVKPEEYSDDRVQDSNSGAGA